MSNLLRPVFVVGYNGSGTSMLAELLGNSSMIYTYPRETKVLVYYSKKFGTNLISDSNIFYDVWSKMSSEPSLTFSNNETPVQIPADWRSYEHKVSTIFDYIMSIYANRKRKLVWCEKTPKYVFSVDTLLNLYPNCKIIHIIRDGRDVARSFSRRWNNNYKLTISEWKKSIAKTNKFLSRKNYTRVSYENLTREPERVMASLSKFLDVPLEKNMLFSSQPYFTDSVSDGKIRINSGQWESFFTGHQIKNIEKIAGLYLSSLGYNKVKLKGNSDIGHIAKFIYKVSYPLVGLFLEFREKLKSEDYSNEIRRMLSYFTVTYKQMVSLKGK